MDAKERRVYTAVACKCAWRDKMIRTVVIFHTTVLISDGTWTEHDFQHWQLL